MRIISWNVRRAIKNSKVWDYILSLSPDLILLQEVGEIPDKILSKYNSISDRPLGSAGKPQTFFTSILVKGDIIGEIILSSKWDWVNLELKRFKGNLVAQTCKINDGVTLNAVSVYNPAWPIDDSRLKDFDVSEVKLKQNPKVWCGDLLCAALKNQKINNGILWVVAGDYNLSETFDATFGRGNKEFLDRMESLGFHECLKKFNKKLIPTFKNIRGDQIIHQIDHIFVSEALYKRLTSCVTGDNKVVFEQNLSDHLPIIADFNLSETVS